MTIIAKFPGKCINCGQPISVGEKIEWEKGRGASHTICPTKKATESPASTKPAVSSDPNAIKISRGSGYHGRPYTVGQVLDHKQHGAIVVVSTSQRYFREDGLSFGVGDDQGYIYYATCRPANEEERANLEAKKAASLKIAEAKDRLEQTKKEIMRIGERPAGENIPEGDRMIDSGNIYGGGDWFVIGPEYVWYVRNNGGDGDNWSANNVRTGGAGAIGWRVPAASSADLIEELRAIERIIKTN